MCVMALAAAGQALAGAAGVGGAAGAAGVSAASGLATLGTAISGAGSIWQGINASRAANMEARALGEQAKAERQLTAVKDQRTRAQFQSAIREQFAQFAGRGVQLDSPTAVLLGQSAAQEMSFESQAIRSEGAARQVELSAAQRIARGRARQEMLGGVFNAASSVMTAAPKLWPELLS